MSFPKKAADFTDNADFSSSNLCVFAPLRELFQWSQLSLLEASDADRLVFDEEEAVKQIEVGRI